MLRFFRRRVALVLASLVACGGLAARSPAETPGSPEQQTCPTVDGAASPLTLGRRLNGLEGCGACHAVAPNAGAGLQAGSLAQNMREDPWVLNNEIVTWTNEGRHRQAYATLLGERSQRMGRILGVERIEHDGRCLACHATVPAEWMDGRPGVVEQLLGGRGASLIHDGVSCEACHGASGDSTVDGKRLAGWQNPHWQRWAPGAQDRWRFQSIESKQTDNGFYDVRSPASRARMCVSCHVGDPERGRVVTHAMYAAGHPPLPAFEVETFLRDMPPHWRVLGATQAEAPNRPADPRPDAVPAKGNAVTREFLEQTKDDYFAEIRDKKPRLLAVLADDYRRGFDRTRSLAVGAIVTWAQGARVAAQLAGEQDFPLVPAADRWPELAAFECGACHHDLKIDGWRARRRPPTTPGRPLLRDWSTPLFAAVVETFAGKEPESILAMEHFLDEATTTNPYGDPAEIAAVLQKAAADADRWAQNVERRPMGRRRAIKLLTAIARVGGERVLDYESARHLAWGFDEVLREVDPAQRWAPVQVGVARARAMFVTDLATESVRVSTAIEVPGLNRPQPTELINLREVLRPAAAYDADQFREACRALSAALAARS